LAGTSNRNGARITLRWRLLAMAVVLVLGIAVLLVGLMRGTVRRFVRDGEIERMHQGPLVELKQRCTDYLTDRARDDVEAFMASLAAKHSEVAYICFVDPELSDGGLLASSPELAGELASIASATAPAGGQAHRIGGETVIDITETTPTKPAYVLHLGLRKAVIQKRTHTLFVKITFTAAAIALLAVALAFGAIIVLVGPIEKLADDASRLSLGDMRITFKSNGRGELGRLAEAIDRLKESVLCGLRRGGQKSDLTGPNTHG